MVTAFRMITVEVTGFSSGKMMRLNTAHLLQPSIQAASSSSVGMVSMKPRYNMMVKGRLRADSIMTMENIGAVIDLSRTAYIRLVGERVAEAVPITVGTLLKVTPKVIRDGGVPQIQLFIDIEDGSLGETKLNETPVVERSVVATQMVVDDQQSMVVGGYNVQSNSSGRNGVPGVSKVPVFGGLFRSESDVSQARERIFIITPRLIDARKAQVRAKYVAESVQQPQTKIDGNLKMDLSGR